MMDGFGYRLSATDFLGTVIAVCRQNAYNDDAIPSPRFSTPGGLWKTFANKWLERIAD
jgi:hypothetical protein